MSNLPIIIVSDPVTVVVPGGGGPSGPPGPPGSGSTIGVKDEGSLVGSSFQRLNFKGPGVVATANGIDADIDISGGGTTTAATRAALKAIASPAVGSVAYLFENPRQGWFEWQSGNFTTQIAADPYEAIYIQHSTIAATTGAWVRTFKGPLQASWAGFADGATNNAERLESLISMVDATRGNTIELPLGDITMNRRVVITHQVRIVGKGAVGGQGTGNTRLIFPAGQTGFRIQHWNGTTSGAGSVIEHVKCKHASFKAGTGLATYNPGTSYTAVTLAAAGDFQNGEVIWIEGAGLSMILKGRFATTTVGSNAVTMTMTGGFGNYFGYIGQKVSVAGAGPGGAALVGYIGSLGIGGNFTIVDNAGAAVNASVAVAGASITVWAPMVCEIQSGGGTTNLVVDAYAHSPQAVVNAPVQHAEPIFYCTTSTFSTKNVECGGDCKVGLIMAGITTGAQVADNGRFYDSMFAANLAGVVFQGNDAQVNSFYGCDFAGPRIGVLDDSLLGNYFYGCHWAFNCAFQFFNGSCQVIGGYVEGFSAWAANGGIFFGTMSLSNGAGLNGYQPNGGQILAPYTVFQQYDNGSPGFTVNGGADFTGIGRIQISNNGNAYGGSSTSTGLAYIYCPGTEFLLMSVLGSMGLYSLGAGSKITFNPNGNNASGECTGSGFNVVSGKAYYVAGTKVLGAQGASLPADATDLATALTLLNAIKARLKATGGHGLVAD